MTHVDWWMPGGECMSCALAALPDYLMQQRWFPVKDGGTPAVSVDELIPLSVPGQRAALVLWQATSANRGSLRMCLPLAVVDPMAVDEPAVVPAAAIVGRVPNSSKLVIDAMALDPVVRALVLAIIDAPPHRADATAGGRSAAPARDDKLSFGNTSAIKSLLSAGPDEGAGRSGSWCIKRINAGDTTVAILQAFVANEGDGWTWLLEGLRSDPTTLAADAADPAFAPEDIVAADWRAWKEGVLSMSQRAVRALEESAGAHDDRTRHAAHDYTGRMAQLEAILDGLLRDAGALKKTRHHGDFHLGQVLVHQDDAVLVDFEGEPMRPLAERRAKHCALRDVAGMLRSLAYAAAVAGLSGDAWLDAATDSFLGGYFERALSSPGCPPDRGAALRLIQFFTIEKALYEVLYELANRPTWVGIPLTALNRLLSSAGQRDDRTA